MKKDSRRLPLSDWQLEDSDRLKAIFQEKRGPLKLTQEKLAEALGDGVTQGAISHFMNRRTALSLKAVATFAKVLDVRVADISPTLSRQLANLALLSEDGQAKPLPGADTPAANTPLPAGGEPAIDLDDHYAFIPQLTAKAAAGLGYENAHVENRSTLAFKREWLRYRGANEKHLVVIYADGESMWPTINSGDVLLVDKSKVDPLHQQVFVLGNTEGIIVKRLVQGPIGNWIIRSDNEDKEEYPDLALLRRDEDEHRIIGQVIWRGGDL
ncbi:transcriptional regulator [Pseudomonas cichorii]|nr:transcriptional regulator [Pseudomonas cichorii]